MSRCVQTFDWYCMFLPRLHQPFSHPSTTTTASSKRNISSLIDPKPQIYDCSRTIKKGTLKKWRENSRAEFNSLADSFYRPSDSGPFSTGDESRKWACQHHFAVTQRLVAACLPSMQRLRIERRLSRHAFPLCLDQQKIDWHDRGQLLYISRSTLTGETGYALREVCRVFFSFRLDKMRVFIAM